MSLLGTWVPLPGRAPLWGYMSLLWVCVEDQPERAREGGREGERVCVVKACKHAASDTSDTLHLRR